MSPTSGAPTSEIPQHRDESSFKILCALFLRRSVGRSWGPVRGTPASPRRVPPSPCRILAKMSGTIVEERWRIFLPILTNDIICLVSDKKILHRVLLCKLITPLLARSIFNSSAAKMFKVHFERNFHHGGVDKCSFLHKIEQRAFICFAALLLWCRFL